MVETDKAKITTKLGNKSAIEIGKNSDASFYILMRDKRINGMSWEMKMTQEQAEEIGAGLMQLLSMR